MKQKILVMMIFSLISFYGYCSGSAEDDYQSDADIIRLQHFNYYIDLINQYYIEKNEYPFSSQFDAPAYVFIATEKQASYIKDNNPDKHYTIDDSIFFLELEKVLNKEINEKYDPQKVPNGRPNFYIYMIDGYDYFFAVHLANGNTFTKQIGKKYFKIEASNLSSEKYKLYTFQQLLNNNEFIKLFSQSPKKAGFFEDLEEENKKESKKK